MTQIAFQLPDADLETIDSMIPDQFPSRAEALRTAVSMWLRQVEEQRIDAALAAGYDLIPPGKEELSWANISAQAFNSADLEW